MIELPNGFLGALRGAQLEVLENAPLAPQTTFRIGGHARVLVSAHSPEEQADNKRSAGYAEPARQATGERDGDHADSGAER